MTPAPGECPSTHGKGREGERTARPPPAPTASVRPPRSAARPQLAWCLRAPITPSITAPRQQRGEREREGRGEGGPGWSSPAGPGLAATGLVSWGRSCRVPSPQSSGDLSHHYFGLSERGAWQASSTRPHSLPMPHSFQPLCEPQFPHPLHGSSVRES